MRHKAVLGGLLALVGVVAAAFGGEDAATSVTYRLERPDGKAPTAAQAATVVTVLERRLNGAGFAGIEIRAEGSTLVTLKVPGALSASRDEILSVAERPGTLEFRIVAPAEDAKRWREISEELDGPLVAPMRYRWVPFQDGIRPPMLVQTPERPIAAHIEKIRSSGLPDDDVVVESLRADLEQALRDEVFTGDQLARVEFHRTTRQNAVYFEFKKERKPYFSAFTEKHVNEVIGIILDGKVESAPVIRSPLPGEGVIEGGGSGFTEREAKELVAILASGALPGRLVRVPTPETK